MSRKRRISNDDNPNATNIKINDMIHNTATAEGADEDNESSDSENNDNTIIVQKSQNNLFKSKLLNQQPVNKNLLRVLELQHQGLDELPSYYLNYDKCLRKLHLEMNNLETLPKLISFFNGLRYLNVSENEIEIISSEIGELKNLRELDANKNNINKVDEALLKCGKLRTLNLAVNPLKHLPAFLSQLSSITQLYLNETQLDTLPESLGNLTNLTILELRENNLTTLPKSFCLMTKLERLDIGNNSFTDLPDVIGTLFSLKELWCDMNELMILPSFIGCLKSLDCLDASKNKINHVSKDISGCTLLTDLHLSSNHLKEIPDTLGCLEKLSTIKLDSNQLTKLPDNLIVNTNENNNKNSSNNSEFDSPAKIIPTDLCWRELIITNNCISQLPKWIGNLRNLRTLYLDDNLIEELPYQIGQCSMLAILSVRNNKIRSIPESIGNLSNLKVLNLCDNKLSSLPTSLLNLKQLTALWLAKNQSNPLIPMQIGGTNEYSKPQYLTCHLLPQKEMEEDDELHSTLANKEYGRDKSENMNEVTFHEKQGYTISRYFTHSNSSNKRPGASSVVKYKFSPRLNCVNNEKIKSSSNERDKPVLKSIISFPNLNNSLTSNGKSIDVKKTIDLPSKSRCAITKVINPTMTYKQSLIDLEPLEIDKRSQINDIDKSISFNPVSCQDPNQIKTLKFDKIPNTTTNPINGTNLSNSSGYSSDGDIKLANLPCNNKNKHDCLKGKLKTSAVICKKPNIPNTKTINFNESSCHEIMITRSPMKFSHTINEFSKYREDTEYADLPVQNLYHTPTRHSSYQIPNSQRILNTNTQVEFDKAYLINKFLGSAKDLRDSSIDHNKSKAQITSIHHKIGYSLNDKIKPTIYQQQIFPQLTGNKYLDENSTLRGYNSDSEQRFKHKNINSPHRNRDEIEQPLNNYKCPHCKAEQKNECNIQRDNEIAGSHFNTTLNNSNLLSNSLKTNLEMQSPKNQCFNTVSENTKNTKGSGKKKKNFLKDGFWIPKNKVKELTKQTDKIHLNNVEKTKDNKDVNVSDTDISNKIKSDQMEMFKMTMVKKRGELGFSVVGGVLKQNELSQCRMCRLERPIVRKRSISLPTNECNPLKTTTDIEGGNVENKHDLVKEKIVEYFQNIGISGKETNLNLQVINVKASPHSFKYNGIFVNKILKNGPADGILQTGDEIINVNGNNFRGICHEEAVNILKNSKAIVNIIILRK